MSLEMIALMEVVTRAGYEAGDGAADRDPVGGRELAAAAPGGVIYRVRAELPSSMTVTIWTGAGKTSAQRVIRENRKQYPRVYIEKSEGFEGIQRRWR